ncbi:MAG: hypothetical protein M1294_13100 [Firmicutes bacterium]|jgi:hypothetical protein|uniref:N-acetyltransferase domain-containing protein n=1 Tax=Sulfobacillus benefaciens TaxID=453960 RepID=A0A2T2WFH1_9FIRM|nr:hypothetical protein [Bacillota bacterium]PSR20973.1 MAG: hypothetical protein C7B43_21585 [Sulfobacillus benefaciens]HBQ95243.1 hypothetical protein [Sulfobacillus sp.]
MSNIRVATKDDIDVIAELIQEKRLQYETYQPIFWRVAPGAVEKHRGFIECVISQERTIALVWEQRATIEGFIIANIISAPPVYEPGGPTCMVDDYWVRGGRAWDTIGRELLERASIEAKSQFGAAQILVVCGHKDNAKRTMLQNQNLQIASEWYVKGLH